MLTGLYLLTFVAAWLIVRAVQKYTSLCSASRAFGAACPYAGVVLLHPFRDLSIVLGPWFPFKGQFGYYFARFSFYLEHGSTCIGSVTLSGSIPTLWLADAQAIKTIATETAIFQKDVVAYETLNIYGPNMVGTEGADWKRHRKVANPAFNEEIIFLFGLITFSDVIVQASNAFVWMETVRVANEWFAEMDAKTKPDSSITIDAPQYLVQATLLVVASAGFGRRASWKENSSTTPPAGHKLAFRAAVSIALEHLFFRALTPKWIHALSIRVRLPFLGHALAETRESFEALRLHMVELVSLSRAWVVGGKVSNMDAGLLRNLVEANMTQEDDVHHKKLTDDELLSDIFTFLLAGHETSAHSLSFAVGLLALYPAVQQKIYKETMRIWPDGCPTSASPSSYKEYFPKLQYTLATFHETLRLFTPVARLSKIAHADTTLTAHRFTPGLDVVTPFDVPVRAGSMVVIDVLALHMNPMYWGHDVEDFRPERFVDTETYRWPRDAFFGFSGGPRSCIGQRFALAESVCMLASLVRRYEILVPKHLAGKSFSEQKRTLLKWKPGVTVTPTDCVVRLKRRDV
ncbi:Cytochrome P450 [Mycena venus]|uniref:Cytochrome P450 n=1 Tax=Mycena venus TaxID=2733690 RepID=A0A8H6YFG9_9AGAR|nr:Cytochrome P450 [Mycena venus]